MFDKKAMMAIGTLIIFIAIILISAIVAGFLIGTTGILQQKSAVVMKETEDRLISGIEVMNLMVDSNVTNDTVNDYSMLVRLKAGSDPINLKNLNMIFTTEKNSYALLSQDHRSFYVKREVLDVDSTGSVLKDINFDSLPEVIFVENKTYNVTLDNGSELINKSVIHIKFSDNYNFYYNLTDISNVSENNSVSLDYSDVKIYDGAEVVGYLQISSKVVENNTISDILIYENPLKCSFDTLDGDSFCYEVQLGNDDSYVDKGELFLLKFKIPRDLGPDDFFNLQIVPKTGSILRINGVIPSVLVLKQIILYP